MSNGERIELRKHKRNPEEGEIDITPMIDVTFLLLAFFVVVSRMDPQSAVDLPKASSRSSDFAVPRSQGGHAVATAGRSFAPQPGQAKVEVR